MTFPDYQIENVYLLLVNSLTSTGRFYTYCGCPLIINFTFDILYNALQDQASYISTFLLAAPVFPSLLYLLQIFLERINTWLERLEFHGKSLYLEKDSSFIFWLNCSSRLCIVHLYCALPKIYEDICIQSQRKTLTSKT